MKPTQISKSCFFRSRKAHVAPAPPKRERRGTLAGLIIYSPGPTSLTSTMVSSRQTLSVSRPSRATPRTPGRRRRSITRARLDQFKFRITNVKDPHPKFWEARSRLYRNRSLQVKIESLSFQHFPKSTSLFGFRFQHVERKTTTSKKEKEGDKLKMKQQCSSGAIETYVDRPPKTPLTTRLRIKHSRTVLAFQYR